MLYHLHCLDRYWARPRVGSVRGILKTTPQITKDSVHSKGYITTIYDNKGSTIKTLSNHDSNRIYTPLSSIPKNLQHAFIAIEDERYYSHNGIDLYGIIRATSLVSETNLKPRGKYYHATVDQEQCTWNSAGKPQWNVWNEKIKEQSLALELEKIASKQYILEEYLNAINLEKEHLVFRQHHKNILIKMFLNSHCPNVLYLQVLLRIRHV